MKSKSLFDEYTIKEKLGEGAYGSVYKVQHKFTNFLRAVKAIKRIKEEPLVTLCSAWKINFCFHKNFLNSQNYF